MAMTTRPKAQSICLQQEWCRSDTLLCVQDVFQDEEAIQVCIYCHHPCDADVSGFHPAWSCAWCRVHCHVSCYHAYHSDGSGSAQHDGSHDSSHGQANSAARSAAACVNCYLLVLLSAKAILAAPS